MTFSHHALHGACQRHCTVGVLQDAANQRAQDNHQGYATEHASKTLADDIGNVGIGNAQQHRQQYRRAHYRQEGMHLPPRDSHNHQHDSRSKYQ